MPDALGVGVVLEEAEDAGFGGSGSEVQRRSAWVLFMLLVAVTRKRCHCVCRRCRYWRHPRLSSAGIVDVVVVAINGAAAANGGFEGGKEVMSGGVAAHGGVEGGLRSEVKGRGTCELGSAGELCSETSGDILTFANS